MISMILALGKNNLLGCNKAANGIPWDYKEDLSYFRQITLNKTVVMGHKTYKLIGRPLPKRRNIIMSRDNQLTIEGVEVFNDYKKILNIDDVIIIGGVEIFRLFNDYVDKIYLTRVLSEHTGDSYYNDLDLSGFIMISSDNTINENLDFQVWERK